MIDRNSDYPTGDCPKCDGKWVQRSERVFHPEPDDGIRVAWVCENDHVFYGGESWVSEKTGGPTFDVG